MERRKNNPQGPVEKTRTERVSAGPLKVSGARLEELPVIGDERGSLLFAQSSQQIPFVMKRFFVIFDVPEGGIRGRHAHRENKQFLVCLKGKCLVSLNDGKNEDSLNLNSPDLGLYIPPMVWTEISGWSRETIVLVQVSDSFSEEDYVRDYNEFLKLKGLK